MTPFLPKRAGPSHQLNDNTDLPAPYLPARPPMIVSSPSTIEIKLDRLIDDMRLVRSQMIRANNSSRANRHHHSRRLLSQRQGQF